MTVSTGGVLIITDFWLLWSRFSCRARVAGYCTVFCSDNIDEGTLQVINYYYHLFSCPFPRFK